MPSEVEKSVASILRLSVFVALALVAAGIASSLILHGGQDMVSDISAARGSSVGDLISYLLRGEAKGFFGLVVVVLMAGVVLSVINTAAASLARGDRALAGVSIALLLILAMSIAVGLSSHKG